MTTEKEIIQIRRYFHKYPELSGCELNTAKFIESKLKEYKIPYKRIGKTGVLGIIKGVKPGKTVALRADMDALSVQEDNSVEYKSKNAGIMHSCGHDAHMAVVLGAAKLLSRNKAALNGNVKFIFQPSEETSAGAKSMVDGKVLENPKVDVILGVHVCPWIESGKIGLKYGAMMAAVDKLNIEFEGEIAHGAYPHLGKDALVAASAFINSVQTIISREVNPVDPAVITFGKIKGGDGYNIICENITLDGTVRSLNAKTRKLIKESILKKLKAVEIAYGVKSKVHYLAVGNALVNDKVITEKCRKAAKEFYGKENVVILEKPSMGGEDFPEYLEKVPGNFMYIGTSKNKATSYPWHHSNFNIDESALPKASQYLTFCVQKFLSE
ncbi:MAG: M20 family metallopeptidase [Endomicrobia bacterium]|nr:M20 family metallopeptidase [Endomicrobiia bacterium]MCL2507124.1 M20 family metallopeptidase [Endomicrobiia bacterium]